MPDKEAKLYPLVERWMRKRFVCFKTGINIGLRYSRVDVLGIRDIGGDLSGEVETIGIEVKKRHTTLCDRQWPSVGIQGLDANKVYLADVRGKNFTAHELDIATNLRIGLHPNFERQMLRGPLCSSPHHNPITRLSLHLIEKMALGKCQLCNSFFEIGEKGSRLRAYVAQENFSKARESGKGMMFWNREVAKRKDKLGIRSLGDYETFERRYFCPDCIRVLAQVGGRWVRPRSRMGKNGAK